MKAMKDCCTVFTSNVILGLHAFCGRMSVIFSLQEKD